MFISTLNTLADPQVKVLTTLVGTLPNVPEYFQPKVYICMYKDTKETMILGYFGRRNQRHIDQQPDMDNTLPRMIQTEGDTTKAELILEIANDMLERVQAQGLV